MSYFFTWSKQKTTSPIPVKEVIGNTFILKNDKQVHDLSSVSLQASFGLKNHIIEENIINQLKVMPLTSPKATFPLKERISQQLLRYLNQKDGKIFYTVSGAESVENALKMARHITGKKIILSRKKSYHGSTLGAISVTGDWRNNPDETISQWTKWIPEAEDDLDLTKTEQIITSTGPQNIAAFCLETIPGANGVNIAPLHWWEGIQSLCHKYQIKLILDEVVCGFERTGSPFGFHHYNINPDFVCMAKAISGGFIPFGALYVKKDNASFYDQEVLRSGLTNYAHPLGLAALKGVLEITQDNKFKTNLQHIEKIFSNFLQTLLTLNIVKNIRVKGMLACIDLLSPKSPEYFLAQGLNLICRDQNIILAPALTYSPNDLKNALFTFEQALNEI